MKIKASHILIQFKLVLFENPAVSTGKLRLGMSDLMCSPIISEMLPSNGALGFPEGNAIFSISGV